MDVHFQSESFIIFGIVSFVICVLHVSGYGNHAKTDAEKQGKPGIGQDWTRLKRGSHKRRRISLKSGMKRKPKYSRIPLDEYNEVIGKTKNKSILKDPDVARKNSHTF